MVKKIYRPLEPCAVAVLAVACSFLLTRLLAPVLDRALFALFYAAVAVSAWYGGWGAGMLAAFLSVCFGSSLFLDPLREQPFARPATWACLSAFATVAAIISAIEAQLRAAKQRIEQLSQQLQESEDPYRCILNTACEGIFSIDAEARAESVNLQIAICDLNDIILFWNRGAEEMYGWSASEAKGKTAHLLLQTEFPEPLDQIQAELLETDRWEGELVQRRRDGTLLVANSRWALQRDKNGAPIAILKSDTDITAHKKAVRDRDRFFNLSPDIMAIADFNGVLLQVNPAWEKILGMTAAETREQNLRAFLHPDDLQPTEKVLEQLISGKPVIGFENRYRCRDGSYRWLYWSAVSFPEERLIYSFASDITARKLAEEERIKLIDVLEASPDFISYSNSNGRVLYFNKAARQILGVANLEEFNRYIPQGHPDWANERINSEGIPTAAREGIWLGETAILTADGREIPVSQLIQAHKGADGTVTQFSTIARDITQQKQIEATLRESAQRWQGLLEEVHLVVVGLDKTGRVEYVNPFFLQITGYSREEVIGANWFETFLPAQIKVELETFFRELMQQKGNVTSQHAIATKSGAERIIAWNNTLVQNLSGEVTGTMSIGEDITERQALERMKDEFISVVSHELRTPLTSIHGGLGLISSGLVTPESENGRRILEIAAESTERLVRLVNDILDLERLQSGKMKLSRQRLCAAELLRRAAEEVEIIAESAGITLSVSAREIALEGDRDRLIQVLTNLLSNAIKFSPSGSTVSLTVCLWDRESSIGHGEENQSPMPNSQFATVLFQVTDTGRGIPADKLESIFDRFQQVDASDSRQKGGTGLGLAICKSIILAHGGQIWVESILGKGSTFYFTLPATIGEG